MNSQWTDALISGSLKTPAAASSCHCGEGRRMEFLFSVRVTENVWTNVRYIWGLSSYQLFDVRVCTSSSFIPVQCSSSYQFNVPVVRCSSSYQFEDDWIQEKGKEVFRRRNCEKQEENEF